MEENTQVAADTSVDSGNLESTTPEEVASILHLPNNQTEESNTDEQQQSDTQGDDGSVSGDDGDNGDVEQSEPVDAPQEQEDSTQVEDTQQQATEAPTFALEVVDANGKSFTINPGDSLEEVLADFEPKNNGQIIQLLNDVNRLAAEKADYESRQAQEQEQAARQQEVDKIMSGWTKEQEQLVTAKRLPVGADGKPKQDRIDQVFAYMQEENSSRLQTGKPLINSFEDALDKLELKEQRQNQAKAAREAKEAARKTGSLVGGTSSPSVSQSPTYSGGARTASEAARMMGLL